MRARLAALLSKLVTSSPSLTPSNEATAKSSTCTSKNVPDAAAFFAILTNGVDSGSRIVKTKCYRYCKECRTIFSTA